MPAAQAAKPVLLQYTTLLEFYDDYPTRNTTTATTSHGNPITSPVPSINSTDPHLLPRHILQDQQMCQAIITRGQDYLASLAAPPGNIPYLHLATQMLLRASLTGDGSLNTDLFVNISAYVRQFVEIADRLSPGDVQSVPCEETHCEGVERTRSIRKLTRDGVDRVIVKMQSVAAFNHHASEIQAMAGANNRDGTDIVLEAVETGARSTIYKIGMHMIERSCPWGVLLGGDEFMLFHLDTRISGNDTYHHLVVSDRHAAFPAVADPHMLSLIQVLIALVLGDKLAIQYTSRHVEIRTRYATSERPDKLTESRPCEGTADSKAIGQGPTNATAGPSAGSVRGRRRRETGLQTFDLESLLDGVDLCSVSYPNSGAPTREIAFARVIPPPLQVRSPTLNRIKTLPKISGTMQVLFALVALAASAMAQVTSEPPTYPCAPGTATCQGSDLMVCTASNTWTLSAHCVDANGNGAGCEAHDDGTAFCK
ncbi:hypothetical protein FQN54_006386 [Arachnomyces sp. PD_36]|nr:hypothetical protein FQN54_006386 [Arachnomyces sp. PD_36]